MKKWLHLWWLLLVVSFTTQARDLPDFTEIVKAHGASVVNITSTHTIHARRMNILGMPGAPDEDMFNFFHHFMPPDAQGDNSEPSISGGSGFIISSDGYILTNAHVVENADKVTVKLTDKREFKAKVVGIDKRADIALLKIPAMGLPKAPIGDPQQLQVGEWVLAIGSPFGFENSVTAGIVSAKNRSLPDENYVPFIQTDAAVNPGNSGGPLFNMKGEVVGINSQIFSRSGGYMGVSFAIPIDVAMQVADQLKQYGKVRRARLGVVIQEVSANAASAFGLAKPEGALIAQVDSDGPAAKAGLKPGDVILKFNGQPITRSIDLPQRVAEAKPGSLAHLDIWRNRAPLGINVTLTEMTRSPHEQTEASPTDRAADKLGLVLDNMSDRKNNGVIVQRSEGLAANAGIQPGDVIVAVGNTPVHNVAEYRELSAAALKQHAIALLIKREDETIYITLAVE